MRFSLRWSGLMLAASLCSVAHAAAPSVHYQVTATSSEFPAPFEISFDWPSFIAEDIALVAPAVKSCGFIGLNSPCTNGGLYFDGQNSWLQGPPGMAAMISFMDAPGFGGVLVFVPQESLATPGVHAGFSYYQNSTVTMTVTQVPEPDMAAMLAVGLVAVGWLRRRR